LFPEGNIISSLSFPSQEFKRMETQTLRPSGRYRAKLFLVATIFAALIMAVGLFFSLVVLEDDGPQAALGLILLFLVLNLVWYLPTLLLIRAYFRSLRYEVQDDEVIVHVGIWTKSVKHVPFRTVTNLKVNRDIFDRWFFDLGSLNVQTAGMSGSTGAEEALVGLPNVQEIYELVRSRLRRYRGAMAPTAAEEEGEPEADTLRAILTEIKAIRAATEK
jgi:uncharacterized membrane protein YdbT with pleckstrin-like domain